MPGHALKAGARKLIFNNSPRLLFISLMYVVFITVVSWFAFRLPGSINTQDMYSRLASGELLSLWVIYTDFKPIGVFLAVLLLLIRPVLDTGFISYCVKITRTQKTEFKDLFNGFIFFAKVLSIFIVTTALVFLWSLLLLVPGIVASYRYRQAYYILLDDPRKGAFQCIAESKIMMHGSKLDLMIVDLSFFGWYMLDFLVLMLIPLPFAIPIVSIWLSPYVGLTRAAFYEDRMVGIAV
jgi:uncharacterized membrane protein